MERLLTNEYLLENFDKLRSDLENQFNHYNRIYSLLDNKIIYDFFKENNNKDTFHSKINELEQIVNELKKINIKGKLYSKVFLDYLEENLHSNYYVGLIDLTNYLEENIGESDILNENFNEYINNKSKRFYNGSYKSEFSFCDFLYGITDNIDFVLEEYFQFSKKLSLVEPISQIEGNIVIVGANGSGKSTLSRELKIGNSEDFFVISAQHFLLLPQEAFQFYLDGTQIDIASYQSKNKLIISDNDIETNEYIFDFHNILNYLLVDHFSIKGDTYVNNNEVSILERIIEIFNIVTSKKLFIKNTSLYFMNESDESFEINYLSDGERQLLYFISNVMIQNNDCYYIIDEPENHLNAQVSKSLWDRLEQEKPKSKFIYITHDPEFAASRKNSTIIWSKKYIYPYDWDIEIIEDQEIPEEIVIEIIGSKKNILFCEGSYNSIDYYIYSALFDSYKVMPVGGHNNVINYTKAINNLRLSNIDAKGVIDRDFNDFQNSEKLKNENIFMSVFNEIEMLLIDENVLVAVNEAIKNFSGKEFNIEDFKSEVFNKFKEREERIIFTIIKNIVENKISSERIEKYNNKKDIDNFLFNLTSNLDIDKLYENISLLIKDIYENNDYNKLLEICNLKDEILKGLTNKFIDGDYTSIAKQQIVTNNALKRKIVDDYFKEFE